ncbi:MAG: hypothetical protein AB1659_04910, partial [Thermodesulfobacteriota bacterium]
MRKEKKTESRAEIKRIFPKNRMEITQRQQELLRMLPGVDRILELAKKEPFFSSHPKSLMVSSIRYVIETLRSQ